MLTHSSPKWEVEISTQEEKKKIVYLCRPNSFFDFSEISYPFPLLPWLLFIFCAILDSPEVAVTNQNRLCTPFYNTTRPWCHISKVQSFFPGFTLISKKFYHISPTFRLFLIKDIKDRFHDFIAHTPSHLSCKRGISLLKFFKYSVQINLLMKEIYPKHQGLLRLKTLTTIFLWIMFPKNSKSIRNFERVNFGTAKCFLTLTCSEERFVHNLKSPGNVGS